MNKLLLLTILLFCVCGSAIAQERAFLSFLEHPKPYVDEFFKINEGFTGPVTMKDKTGTSEVSYGFINSQDKWQVHTYTYQNGSCVTYMYSSGIDKKDQEIEASIKFKQLGRAGFIYNPYTKRFYNDILGQWAYLMVTETATVVTISVSETPIWTDARGNERTHVTLRKLHTQPK
jgi:hypothetical protein